MSSLFANLGNPGEKKTGTLFGSTTAPAGGLFGNSQQPAQPAGGLFGGSTASGQQQPQNTLFGATTQPQQQQQQQQTGSGGLFASSQNNTGSGGGLFGQSQQIPQQPQQQNFNNSLFGGMMLPVPTLNPQQAQAVQQAQHGLPQLRQSAQQPFKPAFLPGQSTYSHSSMEYDDLTRRRRKVRRRAD
jgi:nuclear pore complex protein Nup54